VNHARGYMTSATMNNVADNFSWHVKAVMMFDEYVDVEADKEGPTEGYVKNDIRMLRELAEKLMELAQEAGRDIDEDQQENENDRPRAAKKDEQMKDLLLVQ
jgi:6-phosphogluconolactonase/glucosamine-6-phosphate isomerase/deaminase